MLVVVGASKLINQTKPLAEPLPRDFPVHPKAVEIYGYTSGAITHYTYSVPLHHEEVKNYYTTLSSSIWHIEKNWFEQGDGIQKHFKTDDYNPKPGEKEGRAVQVVISPTKVNTTKLVIVATINS